MDEDIIRTDEWVYYRCGEQEPFIRLYKRPLQAGPCPQGEGGVVRPGEPEEDGLGVPYLNIHSPRRGVTTVPITIKTEVCPPSTLSHTHIFEGEEVVIGGDDGQTWIATFASQAAAKNFITWSVTHSKSWLGLRPPESSGPESPH